MEKQTVGTHQASVKCGGVSLSSENLPKLSAVVTGASRGIGLAIARSIASQCSALSLVASSEESFSNVRSEFEGDVAFYGANFSSSEEMMSLAAKLADRHPQIDVLVNNCGTYFEGAFKEANLPDLDNMINVNVRAPIALTRMLIDQIGRGRNSIVINMSSIQAQSHSENLAVYAATKSALSSFSDALRKELNPLGIRVTVVEPSGVNTWGADDSTGLLDPKDIGELIKSIVSSPPHVQIHEVVLSGM